MFSRLDRWVVLGLLACGGGGAGETATNTDGDADADPDAYADPTTTLDPATVPLAGACALAEAVGGFRLESYEAFGYSIIDGAVSDGVVPVTVLTEVAAEGDCKLLRRENLFCDPACQPGETCDADGTCIPYPLEQDLGVVTMTGLFDEVVLSPIPPGFSYFKTDLSHPAYTPGGVITVTSTGGALSPLTLHGVGIEPLAVPPGDILIVADQPLPLTWTPASPGARSTIYVRITVDQHGVTPVQLTCETADDGAIDVPATLVSQLVGFGVTGFPNGVVVRRTVDHQQVETGCASFEVNSPQELRIRVDGFVPCQSDIDCPYGQTCNEALEICE